MKKFLSLGLAVALVGCTTTQQQATYQTLAAAGETLKVSTALWKEYVDYAKANHTVSQDTLIRQAIDVQDKVLKAQQAYDLAVDIAGTTQAPAAASVDKVVNEAVALINSYKK